MKVVHLCPTYFSPDSVVAGAERYSYELAKAMSRVTDTTLVTFGPERFVRKEGGLTIKCFKPVIYVKGNKANPLSLSYLSEVLAGDVIHCHQFLTVTTDLALLCGLATNKKIFVTDLGGATDFSLSYRLPLWKGIRSFLLISRFNQFANRNYPVKVEVIYGGVDTDRFAPGERSKKLRVLHVGRILPHKGILDLLEALPGGMGADIVGQAYDREYYRQLLEKSRGKDVLFHTDLHDNDVIEMYRSSLVTVLPATVDSGFTSVMEAMACGTPVIACAVGSLPEIVEDGVTGYLVPPNDPVALRAKIESLLAHPDFAIEMGRRGRETVMKRFRWDLVARRCLEAYGMGVQAEDHDRD